ncbi:MAG: response regulator transcription factor [Actinomycetota bacterium]
MRWVADVELVGVVDRFEDGFGRLNGLRPDVILLGVDPPADREMARVGLLKLLMTWVKVVAVARSCDERLAVRALEAGCSGFLGGTLTVHNLVTAVKSADSGNLAFPMQAICRFLELAEQRRRGLNLTGREMQILVLLSEGETTDAISEILSLSPHTVRNHVSRVLVKFNVHSRIEAVLKAHSLGLVDLGRVGLGRDGAGPTP